jgi:hypothetical protein
MKKLFILAVMLAGCEPAMTMGTDESFLTSGELRLVQEPAISRLENIKLGVQMPFGCKLVPNNVKHVMKWTVVPSDGVTMKFNKDARMVHLTVSQAGQYALTCQAMVNEGDGVSAMFDLATEGYEAPPVEEPPALDPPVEEPIDEPPMWEACPEGSSGVGCATGKAVAVVWEEAFVRCAALRDTTLEGVHTKGGTSSTIYSKKSPWRF